MAALRALPAAVGLSAAAALSGCGDGEPAGIRVTSAAFAAGAPVPEAHSCEGENTSPPLAWIGVPRGAVDQAVLVEDLDAPNPPFTHWVVSGLGPARRSLAAGELPQGATPGRTSAGKTEYVGLCPPRKQRHRYRFTVLALSAPVPLDASVGPLEARRRLDRAAMARGTLEGLYGQPA